MLTAFVDQESLSDFCGFSVVVKACWDENAKVVFGRSVIGASETKQLGLPPVIAPCPCRRRADTIGLRDVGQDAFW